MKTAIVTGASGNLGQAVVSTFLKEGYQVIGTVTSHDPSETHPTSAFERVTLDLTDEEAVAQAVQAIVAHYGRVDVAVLTVGGFAAGSIAETGFAAIMEQYRLNFQTAYTIARLLFIQMMEQGGGRIFLVGSRPGIDAGSSKGMVAYGLAKSSVFRLAELMNIEGKQHGVDTVVIVPGTIDTAQNRKAMPDADHSKWVTPEAIATVIHQYAQDDLSIIREAVVKVYGKS